MPSDQLTQIPTLPYSDPRDCTPRLYAFNELDRQPHYTLPRGMAGPLDATDGLTYRLLELPAPGRSTLIVQLYNGSLTEITAQLFAQTGQTVGKPKRLAAVAGKLIVPAGESPDGRLYLRIAYRSRPDVQQRDDDTKGPQPFIRVAAYLDAEPGSAGSLRQRVYDRCYSEEPDRQQKIELPFDCGGKATQRLILSSCDTEYEMREWVKSTGLPVVEEYYGPLGSVVALGVEPGLDLNTTGGAIEPAESDINGGEGTVSPDYLINLFKPQAPAQNGGQLPRRDERPPIDALCKDDGKPPAFDQNLDPLVVAIIDSGVDDSQVNRDRWEATRYRQRTETEFIKPWKLGFDFLDKDGAPEDAARHGTSVAATVLNQYRSEHPLNLVHLKTFGAEGISTYFGALVSLYEAATVGADVINMSWGVYSERPPAGLECAITTAIKSGARLVTSAGNDGKNLSSDPQWPAAFAAHAEYRKHLITVASFGPDKEDVHADLNDIQLSSYSNYGAKTVTLAAFMTAGVPEHGTGRTIYPLGTSISAPIVTGLLANWLADHPGGTVTEFCDAFCQTSPNLSGQTSGERYLPLDHSTVLVS